MKNVLGLAFAVPKKEGMEGDENGDAPEESRMRSGERISPLLLRQMQG